MNRDYEIITSRAVSEINHYDGTGTAMSIAANRVSFTFNLTGPSLTVDTACSSFLFALHYALQAIKSGNGSEEVLGNQEFRIAGNQDCYCFCLPPGPSQHEYVSV